MCSFGSSNSAPTTQFSTQTTVADPRAQQMYSQAWQNAQTAAQRPFQPYSYNPNAFVAPMNSVQLSAVNNIYGQQSTGQPYYNAGAPMMAASGNTSAAGLAPAYMSPYLNSSAAATMGILGQQQGMERNRLAGDIAKNGQWGNSRSGVERALLTGQQDLATGKTMSDLYNTGYTTALSAAQTDLTRQLQAGQQLNAAGVTGQNALLGAGTLGQQTQQAGLTALYDQFQAQRQYPFQTAQFLASTAAGLGPGYGGTTSGLQSSQQPLSFFGNPLSDPALKVGAEGDEPEIIGETNDGQDIYRYRVVNPDTGELGPVQIGLMADEVEQRRPDAIGDYKGFRTVDYAKATDKAARMGGGVTGRGDYADGGSIDDILRSHEAMYQGLGKQSAGVVPQMQMQTARLDAPQLSFGSDHQNKQGTGLGDAIGAATKVAGAAKTLWDIGSTVGPALMALSDRRLKTGVRPGRAEGGPRYSDEDIDYVTRTLIKEAGGEGPRGMEAVADVIRNRLASGRYGASAKDVVLAPKQFSPWNDDMRGSKSDPRLIDPSVPLYRSASDISRRVLGGDAEDVTGGATHFYNPSLVHPKWARGKGGLDIGHHRFLTADAGARPAGGLGDALALVAKEDRPSNPGLDAMPTGSTSRGVVPASDDTSPAQGVSGFIRGTPASGLGEKALDFATSERFLVPLLTGLGTMASSGSRFLAPAILQGLGAGAKEYMEVPKIQAETEMHRQEAENKRTLNAKFAEEAGLVRAQAQEAAQRAKTEEANRINNAIVEKGGRLFVRVVKSNGLYDLVPFGEWNSMDPSARPPLAPRDESGAQGSPETPAAPPSAGGAAQPPATAKSGAQGDNPATGFDLTPEHASAAEKAAVTKSGWSTTSQATIPDFFSPQAEVAKSAQDQKQILVPLASSLAQLPKGSSLLTSGRAQEFLSPFASTINNLAAVAGFKTRIADPKDLANQEEVKKLVTQLQREATTSSQMHTLGALRDMAEGIPGIFTSPEGQGKLVAQILTNTQRQIDKNEFFSKWTKAASGARGSYSEWARLTSPEANTAFDSDKGTNARYTQDREYLEKIFNQKVVDRAVVDEAGKPKTMTLMELLGSRPQDADEELLSYVRKKYPGVLRYFGSK